MSKREGLNVCACVHASGVCVSLCVLFVICVPGINDSSSSVSHALSARLSRESVVCSVPACVLLDLKLRSHSHLVHRNCPALCAASTLTLGLTGVMKRDEERDEEIKSIL